MTMSYLSGRQVLLIALGFFALVIGANAIMVGYALNTFSGADEPDAYRKGLGYNDTLALRAAGAEAGYAIGMQVARGAAGSAHIEARIRKKQAPATGLSVRATLRHPADAHRDRSVLLIEEPSGVYAAFVQDVAPGSWDVVVNAASGAEPAVETKERVWLP